MMRENDIPEDAQRVTIDLGMEVYLRHRPDPINLVGTFQFGAHHLDPEDLLESFMTIVTHTVKNVMNSRDEHRFVLSDRNANKFVIETSEIQAMSLLAPSTETITKAVQDSNE